MCSKRAAPAMLAFCWQIYICRDKPRARGKCARRSGGTGLKISCWLPRLYAALSFSLSHALCHRALTCFAPPQPRVWVSSPMKGFRKNWSLWKMAKAACARINLGLLERLHRSKISERTSEMKSERTCTRSRAAELLFPKNPSAAFAFDPIPRWLNIYSGKCGWYSAVSVESCGMSGFPGVTLEWQSECVISCYHPQLCCYTATCKSHLQRFARLPKISLLISWAGQGFNRSLSWPEHNVTSEPPLRCDKSR